MPPNAKSIDWNDLITKAAGLEKAVDAVTFIRRRSDTASHPVYLECADKKRYVVKALRTDATQGRMLFNDQVIARFGALIGAAVPQVCLVNISQELINLNPHPQTGMGHCKPGLSHGSLIIPDVTERVDQFQHIADDDNKNRFCLLGILHGWISFSDRQFLYETTDPFRVSAVDHGHFLPKGPNWTVPGLAAAPPPEVAADLVKACSLTDEDLHDACLNLSKINDQEIARILAIPPDDWGVTIDERVALAEYLVGRRDALIARYKMQKGSKS